MIDVKTLVSCVSSPRLPGSRLTCPSLALARFCSSHKYCHRLGEYHLLAFPHKNINSTEPYRKKALVYLSKGTEVTPNDFTDLSQERRANP